MTNEELQRFINDHVGGWTSAVLTELLLRIVALEPKLGKWDRNSGGWLCGCTLADACWNDSSTPRCTDCNHLRPSDDGRAMPRRYVSNGRIFVCPTDSFHNLTGHPKGAWCKDCVRVITQSLDADGDRIRHAHPTAAHTADCTWVDTEVCNCGYAARAVGKWGKGGRAFWECACSPHPFERRDITDRSCKTCDWRRPAGCAACGDWHLHGPRACEGGLANPADVILTGLGPEFALQISRDELAKVRNQLNLAEQQVARQKIAIEIFLDGMSKDRNGDPLLQSDPRWDIVADYAVNPSMYRSPAPPKFGRWCKCEKRCRVWFCGCSENIAAKYDKADCRACGYVRPIHSSEVPF